MEQTIEMPKQPKPKALIFLIAIMFLNGLGFTIIGPVLPFIISKYISDPNDLGALTGWLTAIYAACQIIAAPGLGLLSDRYGRKPLLLICLLGSAVGYIIFGLGGALWILFASRILDGLTGGNFSIAFAYVADTTEPEARGKVFGQIGAMTGVSFIVGPLIGGLAAKISLETPLYLAAGLTMLATIWGLFFLPESLAHEQRRQKFQLAELNPFSQLKGVFAIKPLRPLLLLGMLYAFPFAVLIANFSVLIIDSLQWDATTIGFVSLGVGIMDILVQGWLIGKLLPIFGEAKLMIAGLVCQIASYAALGLVAITLSPALLILGTVLFAFGSGLIEPSLSALSSRAVGASEQGLVGGASQSLQGLMRVIGPLWVGVAYTQFGHSTPYWLNIVVLVGAILLVLASSSMLKGSPEPSKVAPVAQQ